MKGTGYIIMICLAYTFVATGQNNSLTKMDFFGNWTLDLNEYELEDDNYIFRRPKEFKNPKEEVNITISLLDFNECNVNYDTYIYCGAGQSKDYSWTFNQNLGIINIYHSEKWLKSFKEYDSEEFEKLNLPDKYDEMELSIITMENGGVGLKIINWE
tara:strand:- start:1687 stop:2157 length:471 start_codon:yes stop_codon:yes gene_type:complete